MELNLFCSIWPYLPEEKALEVAKQLGGDISFDCLRYEGVYLVTYEGQGPDLVFVIDDGLVLGFGRREGVYLDKDGTCMCYDAREQGYS